MGGKPVGPWQRRGVDDAPLDLGPYSDTPHLFRYALLYHAVAERSGGTIGPDTVDRWEAWQAAAYLGTGIPGSESSSGERDVMAERIAWLEAREQGEIREPPKPDVPSPAAQLALMAEFEA